ncbi:MAG: Divergent PAP2 family protein [Parcubacteria group bacterium ADurb.Bin316]|nr:MAG: Divergent PAP2 family protein [Parcubacteria group bacterium ADurb.Bin316]HOZ56266.1 divergent PAP2 family protein [bacterium]
MLDILILPLIAGLIAQLAKFVIRSNKQKISLKNIVAYSGMPSGHSAIVVSLATIIGLEEGLNSPIFAITFILAFIIIRDALGLRRYLGEHGKILNVLVKDLKEDELLDNNYPRLLEKIGHTPGEVVVGSVIGFLVSLIGFFFIF